MSGLPQWDAVVLTCPQRSVAAAHAEELKRRQHAIERGEHSSLKDTLVLVAEDPDARIGSGGATFNAMLVVMDHISSLAGYSVRDSSVLEDKRVLIIHVSGACACEPCGKSLASTGHPGTISAGPGGGQVGDEASGGQVSDRTIVLPSTLDRLMEQMDLFLAKAPCGVFSVSTETNLSLHQNSVPDTWAELAENGVLVFATSAAADEVDKHQGLIVPNHAASMIQRILFPATSEAIQQAAAANATGGDAPSTHVLCFSGVIFLSHRVTLTLMEMCIGHPLNACTYLGIDEGVPPLAISLCLDILPSMTDTSYEEYLAATVPFTYARQGKDQERLDAMRLELFTKLHDMPLRFCPLRGGARCDVLPDSFADHLRLSRSFLSQRAVSQSVAEYSSKGASSHLLHAVQAAPTCVPSPGRVSDAIPACDLDGTMSPASSTVQSINSIVHNDASVGAGSVISNCVLGPHTIVGRNCILKDVNLGGYNPVDTTSLTVGGGGAPSPSEVFDGSSVQLLNERCCRDVALGDDLALTQWHITMPLLGTTYSHTGPANTGTNQHEGQGWLAGSDGGGNDSGAAGHGGGGCGPHGGFGSSGLSGSSGSGRGHVDVENGVRQVYVLFGTQDDLGVHFGEKAPAAPVGTYLNEPWDVFLARTGIHPTELWHDGEPQTALNARLFPVVSLPVFGAAGRGADASSMLKLLTWMQRSDHRQRSPFGVVEDESSLRAAWKSSLRLSLRDIMRVVAAMETINARVEQAFHLNCQALVSFLARPNLQSTAFLAASANVSRSRSSSSNSSSSTTSGRARSASTDGKSPKQLGIQRLQDGQSKAGIQKNQGLLRAYRSILHQCAAQRRLSVLGMLDACAAASGSDLARASRTFAWIANMLGKLAGAAGGLRSGPANNHRWRKALQLVAARPDRLLRGVAELAMCRREWLVGLDPLNLVRAARHYERASQILIREAVLSAREFINVSPSIAQEEVASSTAYWTVAEASARIDLAGGWSDTPPIAYEHGGAVANIAVLVDGKRPIGCKVRRVKHSQHPPRLVFVVHGSTVETVIVETMRQLQTYHQPQSPAALLKAAVCCAGLVDERSPESLAQQLGSRFDGCGFEMHSWSDLPSGSGLGTSSILAGCALGALWSAMGQSYDNSSVYHAVLHLEQMLTTGGGWQDQVGGIAPGMKLCTSSQGLPLRVSSAAVQVPGGFLDKLSSHIVLIYTGKTRLARDLLQNVLRNWYSLDPTIVDNVHDLVSNAARCSAAACSGDLDDLGACVSTYWEQKKIMAPGCEPAIVTKIMDVLRPMCLGQSMCGAGGGGFMYAVTKEPDMDAAVAEALAAHAELSAVRVHGCSIDREGMYVRSEPVQVDANELLE